jgi:uncharacterized membrane protein
VLDIIRENQSHLWSFLLSFFVIAGSWMSHRQTFEGVTGYNSALVWAGLLWILTIVFLPFTTGLIAQHGDDQATAVLYIANVTLSSACLTASVIVLARNPGLQDADIPIGRERIVDAGKQTLLRVIAMLVALLIPPAGFSSLFVLPVGSIALRPLQSRITKKGWRNRLRQPSSVVEIRPGASWRGSHPSGAKSSVRRRWPRR